MSEGKLGTIFAGNDHLNSSSAITSSGEPIRGRRGKSFACQLGLVPVISDGYAFALIAGGVAR